MDVRCRPHASPLAQALRNVARLNRYDLACTRIEGDSPQMRNTSLASVLLLSAAACAPTADGRRGDAARDSANDTTIAAGAARTVTPFRLANDGTLTVLTMSPLTGAMRTAADSFSRREAVRVLLDTIPALAPSGATVVRNADIIAISSALVTRNVIGTGRATWSLPFARNRVVLAWTDSSRRAASIDSASWRRVIARRDTRIGRVDPRRAPLGVHTLLAMQLAEAALGESGLARRLLAASPAARTYPSSDSLLAALLGQSLDVIWTYESTARAAGLRWLNLGPSVDLGDEAASTRYDSASTVVVFERPAPATPADSGAATTVRDSIVVRGTPLRYALTIPRESANLALAERFVRFLFSTDGQRILRSGNFDLLDPLVVSGHGVPEAVAAVADSVARVAIGGSSVPGSQP